MVLAKLTKKQQDYVNEGVKLSKEIKTRTDRLNEIKEVVGKLDEGTHVTDKGGVLVITTKDYYTAPSASKLLEELKKSRRGKLFPDCVNVIKKSCDTILGDDTFDRLRKFSKTGKALSFK